MLGLIREFVKNPIGTTIDTALQPVEDAVSVVKGLSQGEVRLKEAARLGVEVATGVVVGEVLGGD